MIMLCLTVSTFISIHKRDLSVVVSVHTSAAAERERVEGVWRFSRSKRRRVDLEQNETNGRLTQGVIAEHALREQLLQRE